MKRVQAWKASGRSLHEYAAQFGFSGWTLRYWDRRKLQPKTALPDRPCANYECRQMFSPSNKALRYCCPTCMCRARYLRRLSRALLRAMPVDPYEQIAAE